MHYKNTILITVPGHPRPQPRPRIRGSRAVSNADENAKLWANFVRNAAVSVRESLGGEKVVREMIGDGPLYLEAHFRIPTKDEERWENWHWEMPPDFDNLVKLAVDNTLIDPKSPGVGLMGTGDNRIALSYISKIWTSPKKAGATLRLSRLLDRKPNTIDDIRPKWLA